MLTAANQQSVPQYSDLQVFFGLILLIFEQRFTLNLSKWRQIQSLPAQQENCFLVI